jgi:ATP-dependent protease HslVU (ClpYQ) ATPase subunit
LQGRGKKFRRMFAKANSTTAHRARRPGRFDAVYANTRPIGLDEMGMNLQDYSATCCPRKQETQYECCDAKKYIEKEEAEKLVDMDAVVRQAFTAPENQGIILLTKSTR